MTNNTVITRDLANKKLHVTRAFAAPVEKVWKAWTESSQLDKWWAPKPWKVETQSMDFAIGGLWLYAMVSPDNEKHYSRVEFGIIVPQQSFSYTCYFCDEHWLTNENSLRMNWHLQFFATETGSKVEVDLLFDKEPDMQNIVAMGFEGGFTMCLSNLDVLLSEA
jgi:uncharacterized protein YndB with AHSA1/START domain